LEDGGKPQAMGEKAYCNDGAGGHGYSKGAAFLALGYNFLRRAIGWRLAGPNCSKGSTRLSTLSVRRFRRRSRALAGTLPAKFRKLLVSLRSARELLTTSGDWRYRVAKWDLVS
jgi:hypothetical protein